MGTIWGREPALILAAVQAVVALAVGFGLDWTTQQVSLVLAATAAILGVVARQAVTSPATLAADYTPRHAADTWDEDG